MDSTVFSISNSTRAAVAEGWGGTGLAVDEYILHLVTSINSVLVVMVVPVYNNIEYSTIIIQKFQI